MKGLFCGSFDPFTLGHLEAIKQALQKCDELIISITPGLDKEISLFSANQRRQLIQQSLEEFNIRNVPVICDSRSMVDNALSHNANILFMWAHESIITADTSQPTKLAEIYQQMAQIRGFSLTTEFIVTHNSFDKPGSTSSIKQLCQAGEYIIVANMVPQCVHQELMCKFLQPTFASAYAFNTFPDNEWQTITQAYRPRNYHNMSHLGYMINMLIIYLSQHQLPKIDKQTIILAIFIHDYVQDVTRSDNEEKSLQSFNFSHLTSDRYSQIEKLVLATKHNQDNLTYNEALIADLDLSILGTFSPQTWEKYCNGVRKEYAIFSDSSYNKGRIKFLFSLLKKKRIFQTDFFYNMLEQQARQNIKAELHHLQAK